MSTHLLSWTRSLCLLAALSGGANMAIAASPEKPAAVATDTHSVSLADGKLKFVLRGFEAQPLNDQNGDTMYDNDKTNQTIIVTEGPLPASAGNTSATALQVAVDTLKEKQHAASDNFRITRERTTNVKGLRVYRLDATDDFKGTKLLMTSLMTLGDKNVTLIEVMSSAKDPAGHAAALKNILGK
ncbi:hypothetical protein FXN63_01550 [Pigmentiphaga aceris]|uniref:DUF1795 domain-containing protein n=1 Tax=Pigmentiphaga aceris TaxID=1940612 RepID=A0A5C0ARE3_9BURK|nr:hypothetical protein [Pigmentiphaga aceris]QEI04669.1 hypothetical protein FXN63_01550 [Pigmentiphaga aceris]